MPKKIVISASRRSDIPAFYMDWFMARLSEGIFETVNPYNGKKSVRHVSPETVHTIVFWSKNFHHFIKKGYGEKISEMGYNLFFNFTVNSENPILEPNIPPLSARLSQFRSLADNFSPKAINWRFDPICYYEKANRIHSNLADFSLIAEKAAKAGIQRCVTSFIDSYRKTDRRVSLIDDFRFIDPGPDKKIDALLRMAKKLTEHDISLMLCSEKKLFDLLPLDTKIKQSACIDNNLLKSLFGDEISLAKDTGQRSEKGCGCSRSFDIGDYRGHPCYHNCLYCYANPCKPTEVFPDGYEKTV